MALAQDEHTITFLPFGIWSLVMSMAKPCRECTLCWVYIQGCMTRRWSYTYWLINLSSSHNSKRADISFVCCCYFWKQHMLECITRWNIWKIVWWNCNHLYQQSQCGRPWAARRFHHTSTSGWHGQTVSSSVGPGWPDCPRRSCLQDHLVPLLPGVLAGTLSIPSSRLPLTGWFCQQNLSCSFCFGFLCQKIWCITNNVAGTV